jgi:hypothetical protein
MQPDREQFIAPLDNLLPWQEPSDSIELFAGPMTYRSDQANNLPSLPGRIWFLSRAGSNYIQWSVDLDTADPAIAQEWQLPEPDRSLGELRFDFLGQPMTVGAYRQSRDYGWIQGGLGQFGSASRPVRVTAHWLNLRNLLLNVLERTILGQPGTNGRLHRWLGRWEIDLGPWHITIDSQPNLDQMYRDAKRNYLTVLTHTMEIRRQDDAPFAGEDAANVLEALHLGFSFALNRWAAPLLPIGFDSGNQPVWSRWMPSHVDTPGRDALAWWNPYRPDDLRLLLTDLFAKWSDSDERETLTFAITTALASGQNAFVEQSLMTTIAGIENLSWVDDVVSGQLDERKWRGKGAAWRIRRLLVRAQIPIYIDAKNAPALAKFAKDRGLGDGPCAVTEIRDELTHPKDRRQLYQNLPLLGEASRLSSQYLDLLILHRLGYQGETTDRTKLEREEWDSQPVPWHRQVSSSTAGS